MKVRFASHASLGNPVKAAWAYCAWSNLKLGCFMHLEFFLWRHFFSARTDTFWIWNLNIHLNRMYRQDKLNDDVTRWKTKFWKYVLDRSVWIMDSHSSAADADCIMQHDDDDTMSILTQPFGRSVRWVGQLLEWSIIDNQSNCKIHEQ